jgi:ElaB/YqjD/DUF883 family membrane-anchored ribosome-binding protein
MLEQTLKTNEGKGVLPMMIGTKMAEQTARMREGAEDLKERVGEMFEDALTDAKRMAKKGRYVAEDLIDDTEYKIKKAPFRSVLVTFAAGMTIGLVAGVVVSRLAGACSSEPSH